MPFRQGSVARRSRRARPFVPLGHLGRRVLRRTHRLARSSRPSAGTSGSGCSTRLFYSTAGARSPSGSCVPAGYGLATHDFPGRRPLLILTMLAMLIPTNALVLPLFLEANSVHLLTSPLAVILPVRPVPVRRLSLLPLLQHRAVQRLAPDGAHSTAATNGRSSGASPYRSRRRSPR